MAIAPTTPSFLRRVAKFAFFAAHGVTPPVAWWLARRDAPKRNDYRNVPVACLESAYRADPKWRDVTAHDGEVLSIALELPFIADDLISADYETLRELRRRGFAITREQRMVVAANDVWTLRFATAEQLSMAREIFLEGCYDLRLSGKWAILDVGANVGLASLFFAAQDWVEHVAAFEPFPPTQADHALNTAANPTLAPKIALSPFGLSDRIARVRVNYDREWAGSMSVSGLGSWRSEHSAQQDEFEIELRPASQALREVRRQFPGRRTLAKIDCEGSEYEILRELTAERCLAEIDAIVMEWHAAPPDELISLLQQAGFGLYVRPLVPDQRLGLIVAWNEKKT